MADRYHLISVLSFSMAGLGVLLSVFLWFRFSVWKIIGELSGRTARKSVKQMCMAEEKAGRKPYPLIQAAGGRIVTPERDNRINTDGNAVQNRSREYPEGGSDGKKGTQKDREATLYLQNETPDDLERTSGGLNGTRVLETRLLEAGIPKDQKEEDAQEEIQK